MQITVVGSALEQIRPKQKLAIARLLAGPSNPNDVAQAAGVSARTLRRWMHEDRGFQLALREAEVELITEVTRNLTAMARQAMDTLVAVMNSSHATEGERLRAVEIVLRWTLPYRDFTSMESRLERIESLLSKGGNGR